MSLDGKPNRYVNHWETIAVTALPSGWRNAYQDEAGILASPCPAILLQEHRKTVHCWDYVNEDGSKGVRLEDQPSEQPYATRAVFADYCGSELGPADAASNYISTLAPGEETSNENPWGLRPVDPSHPR